LKQACFARTRGSNDGNLLARAKLQAYTLQGRRGVRRC